MSTLNNFFTALNNTFDKIYVITLQRATDRHAHVEKELEGLSYELFYGKDKQTFSIEELKRQGIYNESIAKLNHRYGKPMWDGQIGCAWSHAEVYRDVIAKGFQKVLILEDDIVIDEKATENFEQVLAGFPADWELIYFGFAEREKAPLAAPLKRTFYHLAHRFGRLNFSHNAINHLYPKKVSKHIYTAGYHDCTHAYALTQAAAKKLAALQQPISFVADNLLAYAVTNGLVKGYVILPKLINQQYQVGADSASYLNH
ncbi:MAG TPA: glycosyltransferase family 25 protein [Flavisolibacter sp.]|jgi:glycosyl transferase family 25|nr:glycosyltransferase family 25 protein [Flavisolibacter sp.]